MPTPLRFLAVMLAVLLGSCSGVEQKRIRELLNEKGFGTRAQGVGTVENYIAGGDAVVFYLDPLIVAQPGLEQLALLGQPQTVSLDGTIHVPYVGSVPVLGLTERAVERLVQDQLAGISDLPISLTARITNNGKAYFVFGEAVRKGRLRFLKADLTVLEAVALAGVTTLANIGRIQLVRPDAQNPLVVDINLREMVLSGNTTYNIPLQDNDILYIPPTFFGMLTRFIQKLLEPVAVMVRALYGIANVRYSWDVLTDSNIPLGGNPFFFGF